MLEILKEIATLITSLSVIASLIVAINKWTKGKIVNWLQKPVLERIEQLELNDLKQIIVNENIPLAERITAGERYVSLGGNGDIHAHYDVLLQIYKEQLLKEEKKDGNFK